MASSSSKRDESKNEKKRNLKPLDLRYLKAVEIIVVMGLAADEKDFSLKIGYEKSTISRMKTTGRGASLNQIHATITQFDLNANFFFKNDDNLFSRDVNKDQAANRTYSDTVTHGNNSPVVNGDNLGTIKAEYEQIAETIYNQHAPPELENKIHKLVGLTSDIKKMNIAYEIENGNLKQKLGQRETELKETNKELRSVKDELLDVYREKKEIDGSHLILYNLQMFRNGLIVIFFPSINTNLSFFFTLPIKKFTSMVQQFIIKIIKLTPLPTTKINP